MEDVPDDIQYAAGRVVADMSDDMCMTLQFVEKMAKPIAAAIYAERERCAKLCEGDFDSEMRAYGNAFAEMIRADASPSTRGE